MEMINLLRNLYAPSTRRPRVRFAQDESNAVSSATMSALQYEEVKDDLWYGQMEIMSFKSEARKLALSGNLVRGLENCTMERQKHKYLTVRCTVNAHKQGLGAEHTANVSRRCSEWNEEVAFVQACHDYCTVYHPNMIAVIPPTVNTPPPRFPFESKKRSTTCAEEIMQERRVRQRVSNA